MTAVLQQALDAIDVEGLGAAVSAIEDRIVQVDESISETEGRIAVIRDQLASQPDAVDDETNALAILQGKPLLDDKVTLEAEKEQLISALKGLRRMRADLDSQHHSSRRAKVSALSEAMTPLVEQIEDELRTVLDAVSRLGATALAIGPIDGRAARIGNLVRAIEAELQGSPLQTSGSGFAFGEDLRMVLRHKTTRALAPQYFGLDRLLANLAATERAQEAA
ncbi:chromosome segregation ATPase [Sphingobium xanthum]|uniref:hypothetical protein n=1 Tax=Sphingobium xanthum TaxID=1387165 RepID=UPI001C8BAF04|nr:hypothetical protein [Sphingobium xanthum]